MASRSHYMKGRFTLLAILLAGVLSLARWKGWIPSEGDNPSIITTEKSKPRRPSASPQFPPSEAAIPETRQIGGWEELHGCTLAENRSNDGDSFDVLHDGKQHTLRLYFVDCPEKYRHLHNGPRIAEQGDYFGGLNEEETISLGETARDFSLNLMRTRAFTVLTKWEHVFDSTRRYAFVQVPQGDLGELLVQEGLARIHTKGADRPMGASSSEQKKRLKALENTARNARKGAWSIRHN